MENAQDLYRTLVIQAGASVSFSDWSATCLQTRLYFKKGNNFLAGENREQVTFGGPGDILFPPKTYIIPRPIPLAM